MSLKKYLTEAELAAVQPVTGDEFDISIRELTNIETVVVEHSEGSITIALDETAMKMLSECGCTFEEEDEEDKEQVDELAPVIGAIGGALGRGVAAGAGALARGAVKAAVGTGIKAAADKLDKTLFGLKPNEEEYDESLNDIRRLSGMPTKEPVKEEGYDTSHGGPYDRGAADSYYGRNPRPHKIVPYTGADAVKGQMQMVPLTDPAEIAAYEAGYRENDDFKDYGESIDAEINEGPFGSIGKPLMKRKLGKMMQYHADKRDDALNKGAVPGEPMNQNWDEKGFAHHSKERNRAVNVLKRLNRESKEIINKVLSENKLSDFLPPFIANGLWVSDRRGNNILEVTRHGSVAQDIADALNKYMSGSINEAEYQGRKVQLGKPMQGDVKKFKVYVKDPKTGNVKKVNFGDPNMRIKKSNPARRKSFRARHNCDNPGPRTKARYWSCRKW